MKVFDSSIIGMIHLSGHTTGEIIRRAREEIDIYISEGLNGLIVENYHGSSYEVEEVLAHIKEKDLLSNINVGVNILPNEIKDSYNLALIYDCNFIQFDYIAGRYGKNTYLDEELYMSYRTVNPDVFIMGGVWPKYYYPVDGSDLEQDLKEAIGRCDAIVVTGEGTGQVTPLDKVKRFRGIIGDFPLFAGAGVDINNVKEQLAIADGVIVGSYFKHGQTNDKVDVELVRKFMSAVREI